MVLSMGKYNLKKDGVNIAYYILLSKFYNTWGE